MLATSERDAHYNRRGYLYGDSNARNQAYDNRMPDDHRQRRNKNSNLKHIQNREQRGKDRDRRPMPGRSDHNSRDRRHKRDDFRDEVSDLSSMFTSETSMIYFQGMEVMSRSRQGRPNRENAPKRASQFISSSDAGFKIYKGGFAGSWF